MSESVENAWHQIGKHSMRIESPDIVHVRIVGDLTMAEVGRIFLFDETGEQPPNGFFILIDIPEAGKPNLEILRSKETVERLRKYRAFVYYRAQFQHRTVIEIVQKISKAMKLSLSEVPLVAFATETEARAWIDEYRGQSS